jgi:flagellar FliJ protein
MSRIQTLTKVVELAEQRRDEALSEHARRVRELQMAQEQMDQLQGYVVEAQARWAQRGSQGVDVTLLLHHRQFMQKIHHAIEFQTGVLADKQALIDQALANLQTAERELAGLRRFTEKQIEVLQKQVQRQEQKANDEMALNVYLRQQVALAQAAGARP